MKRLILVVIALTSAVSLLAQGTVIFNTSGSGKSHVYAPLNPSDTAKITGQATNDDMPSGTNDYDGRLVIGANGTGGQYGAATTLAQLLGAPGSNQPESSLLPPVNAPVTFRTGTAAGCVKGGGTTFNNIPLDAPVGTFEMVAWDNISGLYPTWDKASSAWQAGLIAAGRSPTFNLTNIGGNVNVPPWPLPGSVSFNLYFLSFPFPQPALAIAPDGSGGYYIRFTGKPGSSYRLQRAPSVTGPWATGASQTAAPSGQVEFRDLFPPPDNAFYRTVQP